MTISRHLGGLFLFVCILAASGCSAGGGGRAAGAGGTTGGGAGGDNGGGQAASAGLVVLSETCGDGKIDANEACDDHNSVLGDGCSPSCQVEAGCSCDAGKTHCSCGSCGDGVLGGAESCDDHNTNPGDGCSAT